ncbi:MAG: DUF2268 domain-containing putative Zn-dependent protease [candidate division Zixibacteria bacterium]|nr:DUF2268 domain-containing putative Zn-dependent protease [candidate division Zixibacteria bacterium]
MKIIDLSDDYVECILGRQDLSAYENSCPALFNHYFKYWAKRAFFRASLNREEVLYKRDLVTAGLDRIEIRFAQAGFDIADLTVVLFVGTHTSNGHAFKDHDEFIVWLPVETYTTPLLVDVFVAHEIIHALHYAAEQRFYFEDAVEKQSVCRQLITEGVATYLTAVVLGVDEATALWADHLDQPRLADWMQQCQDRRADLARFLVEHYHSSDPEIGIFVVDDPDNIFHFRAGYYIGLEVVKSILDEHNLTPPRLLSLPRSTFGDAVLRKLQEMAT